MNCAERNSEHSWASEEEVVSDDGQIGDLNDEHHLHLHGGIKLDDIKLSEKKDVPAVVWQDGIIKTEDFSPLQHDRMFRCKYVTMILVITILVTATSVGLYVWLEHHLSFLLLILLFNTFLILTFAKTGIS